MSAPGAGSLEAMVEDLGRLVECESPSSDPAAVAASAAVVGALGSRWLGAEPEQLSLGGSTHLRWRLGGTGDPDQRVLLLGHHDTVWALGSLAEHPWRVVDGLAFGPGCFDMKAGLVQMFHALALLGGSSALTGVTVLITGDEELGAPTSRSLIEDEARHSGLALVLEGSSAGALKVERKGVSCYEIVVHGRAAHAGLEPHLGANVTVELAHLVLALTAMDAGPELTTVTPTMMTAGTSANTVPATGSLRVDVRTRTRADQHRVDEAIRGLRCAVPGTSLEVLQSANHPPLESSASAEVFALAAEVAATLGMAELEGVAVGGASDGNLAAGAGALTLDGLGAVGAGAHAPGEHVVVAEMPERARLLAGIIDRRRAGWSAPTNVRAGIRPDRR